MKERNTVNDAYIQCREEMLAAGLAGDFQTVNTLLAEDSGLWAFAVYLDVMARENPPAVEKSLNLPNLDCTTQYYRQMISNAVGNATYRGEKEYLETLLKHAPDPAKAAQDGLTQMFTTTAIDRREYSPKADVAPLLLRFGANAERAAASAEARLVEHQANTPASLSKLAAFKSSIG